jgi:L-aminopeptidase/D-esterase-like protein
MQYLEERGIGFDVGVARVPIVSAAILFDLRLGSARARPDARMAYEACRRAGAGAVLEGSVGAGTGATVGKLFGISHAMKSGLGTAAVELPDEVTVAALAAVNAFGEVRDPATRRILAGSRDGPESHRLVDMADAMRQGVVHRGYAGENTTLAVVATNARLTKLEATKVAQVAQQGLVRTIVPVHTTLDGDLVIALSTGDREADLNAVGLAGAEAVAGAIVNAVKKAKSLGGLPAWADLQPQEGT